MRYLSVCSGIEAATAAWHPLGWQPVAFSEVDAFPSAVLAHHYPHVPNLGDMTKFEDWPDADVDVLVGGTPCQSFSVAGLRKGLGDPRGNLMLTFGAIAHRYRPQWLVWENVPGVLSSNGGRDFGTFLGMLGELGYGFAYRVLDAQYFGVAQRRRRVFVVGCAGSWRRAAAVLFERHSLQRHPAPCREARESVAGGAGAGSAVGSRHNSHWNGGAHPPLSQGAQKRGGGIGASNQEIFEKGGAGLVPGVITMAHGQGGAEIGFDRGPTLTCNHEAPIAVIPFDTTQITSPQNGSNPKPGDPGHPLAAGAHAPAICFSAKDHGADAQQDLAPTLRAGGHAGSHANAGVMPAIAFHPTQDPISSTDGTTHGLGCGSSGGQASIAVATHMQVRRLTPRECERLQGFPDDYTAIPWKAHQAWAKKQGTHADGKSFEDWLIETTGRGLRQPTTQECPDGPRYKALGNSMAVPVMAWIGRRIAIVTEIRRAA